MRSLFKALYNNIHWILIIFLAVYTPVPFLSPILFETGHSRPAWWIQTIYSFMCHQRPERSLFLFGEQLTYSINELSAYGYEEAVRGYPFAGNGILGYKVAICVRDVFIYTSMTAVGTWVALSKKTVTVPWWVLLLGSLPMALDGGLQFFSEFFYLTQHRWGLDLANPWYLSNNGMRAVTGMIFGATVGMFIFSELKAALEDNE
jgi:uncharacterized membrane protein